MALHDSLEIFRRTAKGSKPSCGPGSFRGSATSHGLAMVVESATVWLDLLNRRAFPQGGMCVVLVKVIIDATGSPQNHV